MAGDQRVWQRDVLLFVVMVTMECINVGLHTLFKGATVKGMSYHVFVVYSYALAALLLLPSALFFLYRSSSGVEGLLSFNFSIGSKILLLGVVGGVSQMMGYAGTAYSSPALASAISNLVPAFTFILAIIFRMEKLVFRKWSTRAKVVGALVSISGAFVITLYNGPRIFRSSSQNPASLLRTQSGWVFGGLFLTAEYIMVPMWNIIQTQIMREYPAELVVVFLYNVIVTILATIVGIFTEPDPTRWSIKPDIALTSIVCSGIFGCFINTAVHTWALRLKGPVFVAMFKPLSIAIAVDMGVFFLGDVLYLGSIIGATGIVLGFYAVMWGKAKEEMDESDEYSIPGSSSPGQKLPLLHNQIN